MTDAEMYRELSRGCCSRHTVIEKGCATCEPQLAAVDRVRRIIEAADALWTAVYDPGNEGAIDRALVAYDLARGGLRP